MQSNRKIRQFDLYLSSFLSMHGFTPKLFLNGQRISFEFDASDEVLDLMEKYSCNALVPVAEYVISVKRLKSKMFEAQRGPQQ